MTSDSESIRIRLATLADHAALATMLSTMAWESEALKLDANTVQKGVLAVLENPARGRYWVLETPGEVPTVIGMCLVTPEWSDWHNQEYWWVHSIYLLPDYRGAGLLGALISRIEQEAKHHAVTTIRLYVEKQNERAIRAYSRLGFNAEHYDLMEKNLVAY